MLYMPNITDYLKILTDEEVNNFGVINFSECFKSMRETLHFKLFEEKKTLEKLLNCFIFFSNT